MSITSLIVTLTIVSGQLFKIPLFNQGGLNLLDMAIIIFVFFGLFKIKFHFIRPPAFIKIGLIFITASAISLILTPLHLNFLEYLNSFSYTLRFLLYIIFCWVIISGAFPKLKSEINSVLLYSGANLAVLGLVQFLVLPDLSFLQSAGWDPHFFRTVSTFLDPNFAGGYFVLTLIILIEKFPFVKKHLISIFIFTYLALLTTFSRSSYLMFFVSGIIFSILKKSKKFSILTIILFIFLLLGFQFYIQVIATPRNISREESASFRINTWQQGLTVFQISPILGIGFNSYRYAIREYNLADLQFLSSHGSTSNDSSLISVLATTGVVGFFFYILFLISLIKISLRKDYLLAGAILGLVVHSFFANSLFYPPILFWVLLKAVEITD